jgi:hypothetical protein
MKHAAMVLAGTLVMAATVAATAQETHEMRAFYNPGTYTQLNVKRTVHNYESCLKSSCNGVLETALGHIIWLRLVRPDANLDALQERIAHLATEGRTPAIRYRASLAAMVLDSPGIFASVANVSYASENELFTKVSGKAQEILFSDNR